MAHFLKMSAHRQTCGACNPGPCIRLSCTRNSTWVGQYLERHRQLNRQPSPRVVAAPRPRRSSGVGCGMVYLLMLTCCSVIRRPCRRRRA